MRTRGLVISVFLAGTACALGATATGTPTGLRKSTPLTFVWPTSIDLQADGSLLVVENGLHRLLRLQPDTGQMTEVSSVFAKPYAVAHSRSGAVFLSDGHSLDRISGRGRVTKVAGADADIGPIAVASNGDVVFATDKQVFRLASRSQRLKLIAGMTARISGPHGIGLAADGAVLLSDTANGRVCRIDPKSGTVTTLMRVANPRGLDVARDGTIFVVDAGSKHVVVFSPTGKRLRTIGPAFGDPYDVQVAADGGIYVVDTGAAGQIVHVASNGNASPLSN